jgi:putative Ca2+/H+ antiporter (TMEM165/GDT1 family)
LGGLLAAIGVSFVTIFVAELGDKSQLLVLALATRLRPVPLLVGIVVATAILQAMAVGVGAVLQVSMPERPITIAAGVLFIVFGLWTLRPSPAGEEEVTEVASSERSALLAALGAFFLAELGDKTQLATLTLATRYSALGVWIGATLGMSGASALALVVGRALGTRLPERPIRIAAAALFLTVGVLLILDALRA